MKNLKIHIKVKNPLEITAYEIYRGSARAVVALSLDGSHPALERRFFSPNGARLLPSPIGATRFFSPIGATRFFSPNGAKYVSPGQRPGKTIPYPSKP